MNILKLIGSVGKGIATSLIPGAGVAINLLNKFADKDNQLPQNATGEQMAATLESLPEDKRAEVMAHKFHLEEVRIHETNETNRAMLAAEAASTHSTRPFIALGCFWVLALTVVLLLGPYSYAVFKSDEVMVKAIMDGWPLALGLTAIFAKVLSSYFGIVAGDDRAKMDASNGLPTKQTGIIGTVLSVLKG